jgi:hypothetical protein
MLLGWINAATCLIVSLLVMLTRTLSFDIGFTIILTLFSLRALSIRSVFGALPKAGLQIALLIVVGMVSILIWQQERVYQFLDRLQFISALNPNNDLNWTARVDEVSNAFESMNYFDHVVGMGFGAQTARPNAQGLYTKILHIAILLSWWRIGILAFIALLGILIRMVLRYIQSLNHLSNVQKLTDKPISELIAVVVCAPGILTLFFLTFFSGGWSVNSMISLGLIWGMAHILEKMDMNIEVPVTNASTFNRK